VFGVVEINSETVVNYASMGSNEGIVSQFLYINSSHLALVVASNGPNPTKVTSSILLLDEASFTTQWMFRETLGISNADPS
jgi:hypothetical protein